MIVTSRLFAYALMLVLVAADQLSKWLVVENLQPYTAYPVIGDWFRLYLIRNPGAAFSMGESATLLLACFQLFAGVLCLVLAWKVSRRWPALVIALIGAGAIGNFLDRVFRSPGGMRGHVVDFFSFWDFAIFNIADMCITIGVALYLFYTFVIEPKQDAQGESPQGNLESNPQRNILGNILGNPQRETKQQGLSQDSPEAHA